MRFAAVPSSVPSNICVTAVSASASVLQITTPLPAARPSTFTTTGSEKAFSSPSASLSDSHTVYAAVGILFSRMKSFAKALLVSSSAAARVGPKTRRLRRASSSTRPSASGTSGPTTVRSGCSRSTTSTIASRFATSTGTHRATPAMPPLPGAQTTSPTREDFEMAHARACSRPPPPSTRTFSLFDMLSTLSTLRLGNAAIGVNPASARVRYFVAGRMRISLAISRDRSSAFEDCPTRTE